MYPSQEQVIFHIISPNPYPLTYYVISSYNTLSYYKQINAEYQCVILQLRQ